MRLLPALLLLLCVPAMADENNVAVPSPPLPPANPVQMAPIPLGPMTLSTPIDYGVLTVSRERLEVSTPCDVGLYLQGNLTARLYQGQSVTINLPPGEVQVRLGWLGGGGCQPRFEQLRSQTLRINVGEVQKYRIAMDNQGIRLIPAPLNY